MALVRCPECGNQVSERASSCPECGCPLTGGSAGIATLILCRRGMTPFQSFQIVDENGRNVCDRTELSSMSKNEEYEMKLSVLEPTDFTIKVYQYKSGLLGSSHHFVRSETCTVEPNHTYRATFDMSSLKFKEEN